MGSINFEPADIVIYTRDKGMVLKEKSLVAFNAADEKIVAYGTEAEHLMEGQTENLLVVSPLRQGMIADYTVAVALFSHLLHMAWGKKLFRKPAIAVCVPKGIVEVEKKALEDVMVQIGAREIMIAEFPIEQFVKEMPTSFPDEYKKIDVIIGIEKDDPENYIIEELENILQYARQERISTERVMELLQKL